MHSVLYALVLGGIFAVVTPQCTPDQWEGTETALTAYANNETYGKLEEYMHVSYDAENNRSNVFVQGSHRGSRSFHQVITVFNSTVGHRYVIDLMTDECTVTMLKPPFRRACIPVGSIFGGNFFLGLKGVYNVSSYHVLNENLTSNMIVSVDDDELIPVMEIVTGKQNGVDIARTLTFKDITPGIKSTHVFEVPKECSEDDAWLAEAPHLTRQQYFVTL